MKVLRWTQCYKGVALGVYCVWFLSLWRIVEPVTLDVDSKSVTVEEKEDTSQVLVTASCTPDATECAVTLAGITPSFPCPDCFELLQCGNDWCLYFLANTGGQFVPFLQSRYSVTLKATEGSDDVTTIVDVHVKPNSIPSFDPDEYTSGLHVTETLSTVGSVSIKAIDIEGDDIQYSMTLDPSSVDIIEIDSSTGTISATDDLRKLCRSFVTGLVYISDEHHSDRTGPLAVTLEFNDPNDAPIINNLNTEIYVRENEAVGTTFFSLAVYDSNDGIADLSYTVTTDPTSAAGLFSIDETTGELEVNDDIDYESHYLDEPISLTIQVSDGYCDSEEYTLDIYIVDINEPPVLFPVDQTVESCEGEVDLVPIWTNVSDPDIDDVIKFTDIQPNENGYFSVDEDTGVISTTIDYDLDVDKLDANVAHVLTLTDKQGLTATATVTVRFRDCNDNAPVYRNPTGSYVVMDCWPAGTVVGTVETTEDADSSFNQNNVFTHSGSGAGAEALDSGSIVLTKQFTAGETETFQVHATDRGVEPGPLTSKAFYVSLYTKPCPVTTVIPVTTAATEDTTDGGNSVGFWDLSGPNLGWMIAALLLALPLLALPFYFLWRYWDRIRNCCSRKRKIEQRVSRNPTKKPEEPAKPPPPACLHGFWKEDYDDVDVKEQPNRNIIPEGSKGIQNHDTNTFDNGEDLAARAQPSKGWNSCHIL